MASFQGRRVIADRYELLERIGEGGAALVYRARDQRLDRVVALKVLREALGSDREFTARFQREARSAASLNHTNIVDVYDFGQEGSTYYIAMEYLPGGSLKDRIRERGKLAPPEARDVATQVLSALTAAHARGLVHRDVKPQNVVFDENGVAKLTDFGIAHAPDGAETTQVGTTVGTAAYIAPEQALGRIVGPWTDVYGAGLLLYEMLTGHPPFEGGTPFEVAYRQVNEPIPPPSQVTTGVPRDLEGIVMKALQKDPDARFASAREMSEALTSGFSIAEGIDETVRMQTVRMPRQAPAPRAVVVEPPPPPRGRGTSGVIVALGILAGLAMLALLGALAAQGLGLLSPAPPPTPLFPATPTVRASATIAATPKPAVAVVASPTLTGTPTTSPTITTTPTRTSTSTSTAVATPTQVPATPTPPPTATPAPTQPPPPTNTPVPPTPVPGPPTLTPTVPSKPAPPTNTPAPAAPPTNTPPPAPPTNTPAPLPPPPPTPTVAPPPKPAPAKP